MELPFFYIEDLDFAASELVLDEDNSKHIAQVLRMQNGEQLRLTDGKGGSCIAEIIEAHKKKCTVKILFTKLEPASPIKKIVAISLVKNAHRFEWFLEKVTEIGVTEIIPIICSRTEKQHFRVERMRGIMISAMLQSQQTWLPVLHETTKFSAVVKNLHNEQKFIAHCEDEEQRTGLVNYQPFTSSLVLIGPEGDFTIDEIELALQNNFMPVSLGNTRLRTETAGLVAATTLSLF